MLPSHAGDDTIVSMLDIARQGVTADHHRVVASHQRATVDSQGATTDRLGVIASR
jgi:hypothetical protein